MPLAENDRFRAVGIYLDRPTSRAVANERSFGSSCKNSGKDSAVTRTTRPMLVLAVLLCSMTGISVPAAAQVKTFELRAATFLPGDSAHRKGMDWAMDEVEKRSNGQVKFRRFHTESLLRAVDIKDGVSDGRADVGYTAHLYSPRAFPGMRLSDLLFKSDDVSAIANAWEEFYKTSDVIQKEWNAQNLRVWLFFANAPTVLGSKTPINKLDDIKGKSIRAGAFVATAIQAAGGNPIAISIPEVYEALQRGVINGYSTTPMDQAAAVRLYESAKYLVDPGLGSYTMSEAVINKGAWDSLGPTLQKIFNDVASELHDRLGALQAEYDQKACDLFMAHGATVTVLPDEEKRAWKDRLGDSLDNAWKKIATDAGLPAGKMYDEFFTILGKQGSSHAKSGIGACAARPK
jgi:TRAP-type C4-dicarboxylate transport system substrate-binding protein